MHLSLLSKPYAVPSQAKPCFKATPAGDHAEALQAGNTQPDAKAPEAEEAMKRRRSGALFAPNKILVGWRYRMMCTSCGTHHKGKKSCSRFGARVAELRLIGRTKQFLGCQTPMVINLNAISIVYVI